MKNRLLSFVRRVSIQLAAAGFLLLGVVTLAQAQTFTVLHNFTNGEDGAVPYAGVTPGYAGLYQVNLFLPDDVPPNPQIQIGWAGQMSPGQLILPVQ